MQGDAGRLHPFGLEGGQHARIKVQGGGGRGHCAGLAGKNGLVALAIFGRIGVVAAGLLALNVGRQRQVAVLLHQLPGSGLLWAVQRQVEQGAIGLGPAAQQRGIKTAVVQAAAQMQAGSGQGFFADLHVGHHLVAAGQHAFNQQL